MNEALEALARLMTRHGADAVQDSVDVLADLLETHSLAEVRNLTETLLHGGLVPESQQPNGPGRPEQGDHELLLAWGLIEHRQRSDNPAPSVIQACKDLCRNRGSRREPIPGGIRLRDDAGKLRVWDNPERVRRLYYQAEKRRNQDPDFCMVSDLWLSRLVVRK